MRILIAGGGVGGLAAALCLARAGADTVVFEQADSPAEIGAGVQLSPNATRILRELGALGELQAFACEPESLVLREGRTGRKVFSLPVGAAARARYGAPYLHVHRRDLVEVLRRAAAAEPRIRLCYSSRVEAVAEDGAGVRIRLGDGSAHAGDGLVIADGLRSGLRSFVSDERPPAYAGACAWRFILEASPVDSLFPEAAATVWAAPGAHVVTYRIRGGALMNVVGVFETTIAKAESWTEAGDAQECRRLFAGWARPVAALAERLTEARCWGLYERPVPARWSKGPVFLLGDACHPMPPYQAQGAAMALEDAAALGRAVASCQGRLASAGGVYETERRARCQRMLASAHRNRRLFHLANPVARTLAHSALALSGALAPQLLRLPQDWIYAHGA